MPIFADMIIEKVRQRRLANNNVMNSRKMYQPAFGDDSANDEKFQMILEEKRLKLRDK